ncbi:c-type cytochrome [Sedimentitalea sp. JM2-8]|uniref:C-type cytochrome n=1 Tax=Sedimentitalea xiamensis TaxID=3050037 RepID=A0ABT7FH60_9RHOB|nr:c-type cytochrome [Sedimentitalea xiamensis]MDK3074476.1 c-type cytochrome [Sedimentitalea xiamensis]
MFKSAPLAAAVLIALGWSTPGHSQDAEAGETVFKKCKSCHQVGAGAENRAGPVLTGVVGRSAGTYDAFKYSPSLSAAGEQGLVWTEPLLVEYLEDPTAFLRTRLEDGKARSGMSFKLKDEQDRKDVVAYILAESSTDTAEAEPDAEKSDEPAMSDDEVIAAQTFEEAFLTDPSNFEAGKEIWFEQCTHCHGYKAYPGKAPKLKPAKYKPEFVFKRVYKGFKKMPAWKDTYTVDEIRQVVAYVKDPGFSP